MVREFFGFGGYQREAEGYFSWQHLTFVTVLMILMVLLAVLLGNKNKNRDDREKNKVLVWAAVLIDGFELLKIILLCFRSNNPMDWIYNLPLFMCSIQLITIPLAAFSKGRLREASIDFVFVFGLLGAVMGTYFAGNNYGTYPVLGFDNVVSGITHSISGFAALYVAITGMVKLKSRNIPITYGIITGFCVLALIADKTIGYNYMFLVRGDGTPYDILFQLTGGNPILYPLSVLFLFYLYITAFYAVHHIIRKKRKGSEHT